jgi:assimilatory nitrate reductase catalytic subunit
VTGAPTPMQRTRSTCCYCGVGCGVVIESAGGRVTGVQGDAQHPANFGRLCSKGLGLHRTQTEAIAAQARLLRPMRRAARGAQLQALPWDAAMDLAADRFAEVLRRDGADALGFYVSGQLLTEDYYVFNKLSKGLLQTNNIDSNSRLCMSSAVSGYKLTLGADAPPACYEDLARADTLFLVGTNTAFAHPVLFRRIEDARRARPAMRIIVVDPRRTDTAELADLFLPIAPGSDVALFHGMLHVLLWDGLVDSGFIQRHTAGFETLKERLRDFTPGAAARLCGIPEADLVRAAHWFGQQERRAAGFPGATLSLYCQGLNQSVDGTAKNAALINLHLATGQIGRPGAGPFSLTGQPNAMGGREVGAMATLLSAHGDLDNAAHRAEVARLWRVESVPAQPGLTAVELFEAAAQGRLRALWIACTNPAQSLPDQALVRRALARVEFVVLQEAFAATETAEFADLLLPAASWAEKEGTVTNSERCISRVRAAVPAPGEARPDWRIAVDLARRLEARLRPGAPTLFPYESPEAIWNEHRESTRGRDLDITGLSYALLEQRGPQQWPFPAGAVQGQARLYGNGVFAHGDGRARFFDGPFVPLAEPRDARYPFSLLTGRLRDQWHGMSRTGLDGQLFGHAPEPALEMNPDDMRRLGVDHGDLVHLTSRRGSILVPARPSPGLLPTQAFLPMHWGGAFLGGQTSGTAPADPAGVNSLTLPASCPRSRQPELKHSAVKILRAALPWRLLAMAWLAPGAAPGVQRLLRRQMAQFPFAVCVPFGAGEQGVLFRAAAYDAAPETLLAQIEEALGLADGAPLRYVDRRRGQRRTVRLVTGAEGAGERLEGFLLAGDTASEAWVRELLLQRAGTAGYGRSLLKPGAKPPGRLVATGRIVCTCVGVGEARIAAALARLEGTPEQRLAGLKQALRCGTECGSCVPELQRLTRDATFSALNGSPPAASSPAPA